MTDEVSGEPRNGPPSRARRLALVEEAFSTLPERYLGAAPDFRATYHVCLGDLGHTWEVRLHGDRARAGTGHHQARARRDDRHRLGHLAAAARGRPLRHRGVLAAQALRPRRPRPRRRLRGPLPPPERPRAAAADARGHAPGPARLGADDGLRPRRPAPPRPRRHQDLLLRHRRRSEQRLPRPRPRLPRLRLLVEALARRPTTPRWFAETVVARDGRARHRARARRRQLDGRPGRARGRPAPPGAGRRRSRCSVPPSRSSGATSTTS